MADQVILEFTGIGLAEYGAVNTELGIDMSTGEGNWPPGLLLHTGGATDDGNLVVTEVWASREAQAEFMASRLGAALRAGGVTVTPRVTWVQLAAHRNLGT